MKKSTLAILIACIAVVAIAGVVVANNMSKDKEAPSSEATSSADTSTSESTSTTDTTEPSATAKDTTQPSAAQTASVTIQDFAFSPAKLTVKKGTKVTWTNKDSIKHDITPDGGSSFQKSELLAQNESYSFTFNSAGTYTYHCSPHPNMTGTIEVIE